MGTFKESIFFNNKIVFSLNILLFIVLALFTANIMYYSTLRADQYIHDFYSIFNYADHGVYIITAINRLLSYIIPTHLGFHVNDWCFIFRRWFCSVIVVFIAYLLSSVAFFKIRKNILQPLLFLTNYFCILYVLSMVYFWPIECMTGFGRFIIAYLIFVLFWFYYINLLTKQNSEINIKTICSVFLFSIIVGNLSETIAFVSFIAIFLLLIYNIFFEKKIISNKLIIVPLIGVFIGGMLILLNPEYVSKSIMVHSGNISFTTIINSSKQYKSFFIVYFQEIILKHWICYLFIIFSIIISFLMKLLKEKQDRILFLCALFLLIGVMCFYLTFIISKGDMGANNVSEIFNDYSIVEYNNFWLSHHDFIVVIRLNLIFISMLFFSVPIRHIGNKTTAVISVLVILCNLLFIYFYKDCIINTINKFKSEQKQIKQDLYCIDKIIFQTHNNNQIFLFSSPGSFSHYSKYDYQRYFKKIYLIDFDEEKIQFVEKEKALKIYYENGGSLTEEELKNPKFQKLFLLKKIKD